MGTYEDNCTSWVGKASYIFETPLLNGEFTFIIALSLIYPRKNHRISGVNLLFCVYKYIYRGELITAIIRNFPQFSAIFRNFPQFSPTFPQISPTFPKVISIYVEIHEGQKLTTFNQNTNVWGIKVIRTSFVTQKI